MSFLPPRKTSLEKPPGLPTCLKDDHSRRKGPGRPPEPPTLRPNFHAETQQQKAVPAILDMVGSSPWFKGAMLKGDQLKRERSSSLLSTKTETSGWSDEEEVVEEKRMTKSTFQFSEIVKQHETPAHKKMSPFVPPPKEEVRTFTKKVVGSGESSSDVEQSKQEDLQVKNEDDEEEQKEMESLATASASPAAATTTTTIEANDTSTNQPKEGKHCDDKATQTDQDNYDSPETQQDDNTENNENKTLQAKYEQSLAEIANLKSMVERLEEEKASWKHKLERAFLRRKLEQQQSNNQHIRKYHHDDIKNGRPLSTKRPFISTLGDYEHHDFNAILLGLKHEIEQVQKPQN